MNAVELRGVEKRFGGVRALAGIDADLEPGSLLHVSGPNGAGKSTLLGVIAGRIRPTRGSVRVFGRHLFRSADAEARGRVGYLGADPGLYGELSIDENLAFHARVHGASDGRIAAAIDALELGPVRTRRVRTLSLGYRRRAGLARLVLSEPVLWLLDEPWNGLDRAAASRLAELLRAHRVGGGTALVAAHDVGEHAGVFDASLGLCDGRLETGTAA